MARIRTVKPEFWTDEKLTECSLSARLLFIGMLNFSDDNGNQPYSAKRLKMQVFPSDSIDAQPLIDELLTHGVVIEYSVNSEKYLHIKGFKKHQVINRPSATKIPQPSFIEDSLSAHDKLTDGREGKGVIQVSKDTLSDQSEVSSAIPINPCPFDELIARYEKNLPMLAGVRKSLFKSGKNADNMRQRWRWVMTSSHEKGKLTGQRLATTADDGIDWFDRYFGYVSDSEFLTGKNGKWTACNLAWLVTASHFEDVLTGKYHKKEQAAA